MKRIVAHPQRCLACRTCELACALAHVDTEDLAEAIVAHSAKPRIYVESAGELAVPLGCRHCDDAPCVRVCPSGALSRTDGESPVLVNPEKCIGCAFCVETCPFGVIRLARCGSPGPLAEGRAIVKCDLCVARLAEGLLPACVAACPVGALAFEEIDQSARQARLRAARVAVGLGDGEE
jgi:carbon-monoxide dehydrogenase iron sulfur subunit